MIIRTQLKAIFLAILLLGAVSYYILYYKESFCDFSTCIDSVPKMRPADPKTPKQAPTERGPKELNNAR